MNHVSLKHS